MARANHRGHVLLAPRTLGRLAGEGADALAAGKVQRAFNGLLLGAWNDPGGILAGNPRLLQRHRYPPRAESATGERSSASLAESAIIDIAKLGDPLDQRVDRRRSGIVRPTAFTNLSR